MPRSREELVEALRHEAWRRTLGVEVTSLITEAADLLDSLEERVDDLASAFGQAPFVGPNQGREPDETAYERAKALREREPSTISLSASSGTGEGLTREEMEHLLARCTESTNAPKVNGYSCETCRSIAAKLEASLSAPRPNPSTPWTDVEDQPND